MSLDFIGFTYNGKHSFYDLGIYRTSNGSRYDETLTPSLTDKTADATGRDGQYYFYTTAKNRTFTVSYAFDSLTENGLRELKKTFDGRAIHDLIFDEAPYKTWSAKVTGNSQIKHLCFTDENGNRVYKGEGSLTFTCYWPYARTSDISNQKTGNQTNIPASTAIQCNLFTQSGSSYSLVNQLGTEITIKYVKLADDKWEGNIQTEKIAHSGIKIFDTIVWIKEISVTSGASLSKYLTLAGDKLYYTTKGTFEYCDSAKDGRNINHYSSAIYLNKTEWAASAGLLATPKHGENYGDLPAYFTYKNNNSLLENTIIDLREAGSITILEACSELEWDSKTGLVTGKPEGETDRRPIYYSGNSLATIPVGNNTISTSSPAGGVLEYNYWYY